MGAYLGHDEYIPETAAGALAGSDLGIEPASIAAAATSGVKIVKSIIGGGGGSDWRSKPVTYQQAPDDQVSLFEHSQFRGRFKSFGPGQSVANLKSIGFNDEVSSIKVPEGLRIRVYEDANFQGQSRVIGSDTDFQGSGWNDNISSFRVEGAPAKANAHPLPAAATLSTGPISPIIKYGAIGLGVAGVGTAGYYIYQKMKD